MKIEELKDCESWGGQIIKRHGWDYYFIKNGEFPKKYIDIDLTITDKCKTWLWIFWNEEHYVFKFHSKDLNKELKFDFKSKSHTSKYYELLKECNKGDKVRLTCIIGLEYDFTYPPVSSAISSDLVYQVLKVIKAEKL